MPISFAENVPRWLRVIVRRWVRVLGYVDWKIELQHESADEMAALDGEDAAAVGYAVVIPEYLSAQIFLSEELDAEAAEDAVCHELLHGHYEAFALLFRHCWDGRRRLSQKDAQRMLTDLIEDRIQRHVQQLQRARGRRG